MIFETLRLPGLVVKVLRLSMKPPLSTKSCCAGTMEFAFLCLKESPLESITARGKMCTSSLVYRLNMVRFASKPTSPQIYGGDNATVPAMEQFRQYPGVHVWA